MTIHLGDSADAKRFEIPVWHTGAFGQSGVGKTMLLKYMLKQATDEGYRALVIDSRLTNPEFEGIGQDIPLYLEESTDPDVFRSLIEQMRAKGRGNMERYRGGFIEICSGAKSFAEIGRRLDAKLSDKKIKGYTRTMYFEIKHDYDRLMKLIGNFEFSKKLKLADKSPISRMETRVLPTATLQGLVVRSVIEELMRRGEKKLIVLIDEAPNFCHQEHFNPAKEAIQTLDNQGRANELFGWYSGQTLSGFDKANMKNLLYWALGREMERNEAKAVHETQTYNVLNVQEIRRLKQREFLAISPDETVKIMVPYVEVKDLFGKRQSATRPSAPLVPDEKALREVSKPAEVPDGKECFIEGKGLCVRKGGQWILKNKEEEEVEQEPEPPKDVDGRPEEIIEEDEKLPEDEEGIEDEAEELARSVMQIPHEAEPAIIITERIRPAEFDDDTVEGQICVLIAEGFFDGPARSAKDVHKQLDIDYPLPASMRPGSKHGSEYVREKVIPALRTLSRKPYQVLREDGAVYLKGPRPVTHKTLMLANRAT